MADITILGSGGFGLALAIMCDNAGHKVTVWSKFQDEIDAIKRIPDGQLVVVPDIRHEIYRAPNSVLQPYLEMIFEFYDSGEKVL